MSVVCGWKLLKSDPLRATIEYKYILIIFIMKWLYESDIFVVVRKKTLSLNYINPCVFHMHYSFVLKIHFLTSCLVFPFICFLKNKYGISPVHSSSEFAFILRKLLYLHRVFLSYHSCIVFSSLYLSSSLFFSFLFYSTFIFFICLLFIPSFFSYWNATSLPGNPVGD